MIPGSLTQFSDTSEGWARSMYAFLAEKQRRSGSMRTVEGYSRMLQDFFGRMGKQPNEITAPDVFAWAHGVGLSGREPSAVTIGARMACVSSFYRFLIRMGIVTANPCDQLERPRVSPPSLSWKDLPCWGPAVTASQARTPWACGAIMVSADPWEPVAGAGGAACHGCALVAEASCEMRNDYLDRALVVPVIGVPDAAFFQAIS